SANDANAARTPSACFQCPNRATTSVPSATVPTHVSLLKNDVNHDTRLSRKLAKPLNTSKKRLGFGTLRLLLSQFWNRSREPTREFQTSGSGHGPGFFQPGNPTSIPRAARGAEPTRPRHR